MNSTKLHLLLEKCGISGIRDRGTNYQALCPNPQHDERNPSWGISKNEPHLHACFGCGYKGSIVTLLMTKLNMTYTKACQLSETKAMPMRARDIVIGPTLRTAPTCRRMNDDTQKIESLPVLDVWESYVNAPEAYRYLLRRGIHKEAALEMDVKWDFEQKRVLFPWRHDDQIVGFTGRATRAEDEAAKMLPYADLKKGEYLYRPAKNFRPKDSRLCLVEGEIDSAKVLQHVTPNVAALGFGSFTQQQQAEVLSWGFRSVVLFMDDDPTGERIAGVIDKRLSTYLRVLRVSYAPVRKNYPKDAKLDPDSLSVADRDYLFRHASTGLNI